MYENDDTFEVKKLRSQLKHLRNELDLVKEENEATTLNYYDLYKNLENQVAERTEELKKAMELIDNYNQKLEAMLEERTRHLIKTERHAAFSLLSQGIVHNLKNPLSIISGASQLLKLTKPDINAAGNSEDNLKFMANLDKNLGNIEKGTKQMLEMINSLMAKGKNDSSEKIEIININELLQKEIEFLNADRIFKYKIKKTFNFYPDAIAAKVLPGEISQIFQNLVRNAMDAMYGDDDRQIMIATGISGEDIWFSIKDNGPGIPQENQQKIFDPFFSTKPKAGNNSAGGPTGTGLGLHMCSQMVENYEGRIELYSNRGEGAEFKVFLPKEEIKEKLLVVS